MSELKMISFSAWLLAAELLNPTKQCLIEGRLHVQKFDAHAYTWLENANDRQSFDDLIFACQRGSDPASHFESLTGADKGAGDGKIGGDPAGSHAAFEIQ